MFNRILNSQTKTVTFAAVLLAGSSLVSKLLALIRDRLLAGKFGAGEELDIYFAAFRIPDFVYGILVLGGISAVFLPIFSEYFRQNKPGDGWPVSSLEFTNNVLNCFLILLIAVCMILAVFTPLLVKVIFPGFSGENQALAILLTRIMFLSPILLGISSLFSGILQYFNRFLIYSLAPVLYNVGIILGILFFSPLFSSALRVLGVALGVILGAFLHLLIQIPAARMAGFKYRPIFNFGFPGIIKTFKLMVPRSIGTAAYQVNLIVITGIASTLTTGSIAVFSFAQNINFIPVSLIGISFALASFPVLSQSWASGLREKFSENFSSVFRQILYLILPVSLLMFLLRAQIVRLILGTGEFGWLETRLTAASLGLFCLSIFAAAFIPLLSRVFYSFQDTRTPVAIGISAMILNVVLSFLLVWLLSFPNFFREMTANFLNLQGIGNIEVVGLALAISVATVFQFFLLLVFLKKRMGGIKLREIRHSFRKIIIATILMAIFTYLALQTAVNFVDMRTFSGVLIQTIFAVLIGAFIYLLLTFFLKSPEFKTIWSSISEQFTHSP